MAQDGLDKMRQEIDRIDEKLVELIAERARIAVMIGKVKDSNGVSAFDPTRERQVISSVLKTNGGPLSDQALRAIFTEIISACRRVQGPTRIAYLGPEGTFTHWAAMSEFGGSCDYNAADSIPQVFDSVEREHVDFGVVPVENSTEGSVHATLDRLAETNLSICGEILTPVRHALMAKGADPRTIDTVVSHPQALAQCRTRLKDLLPHVRIREASSTAQAAQQAAHSNSVAALGSEILAGLYDLNILERDLQDIAVNLTRFLAIGLEYAPMTGDDKTSIMFAVPHEPGALCNSLATLAKHELNMTKIVSRPSRKAPWEYVFFVDFHGHRDEPKVHGAIVEMAQNSAKLKVLGSYRAAEWGKSHRMSAGPALDRTLQNGSAAVQLGPIANRS